MRTLLFAALAAVLAPVIPVSAPPGPLTAEERAMVVRDLTAAQASFLASTKGLTEAQLRFKPAPERWSIAEVAEHIALVEQAIGQQVQGPLLETPEMEPAADRSAAEGQFRAVMGDRSKKYAAPEGFVPSGTWATGSLLDTQSANYKKLIEFVRATDAPLRWHRAPHPAFGPLDGVQWLVFMAAHTNRHVQQIEEVKRMAEYPK